MWCGVNPEKRGRSEEDSQAGCGRAERARILRRNAGRGLVLCFSYGSAKIEPLPAKPVLASTGGGWIDMGLVAMDRF
jgi:hypothetical protein